MPWLFMRPILYSAFSDGSRAAPMVMPSITALNLRTIGFFSKPSGSWGNSLASTGVWLMLDALSEGCGVGVSSLLGGWLQVKYKITFINRIINLKLCMCGIVICRYCLMFLWTLNSLTSSAHLQLYKYINIILNITMETDQFWGSNWQKWGCSEVSCYFCQWCVSSAD